MKYFNSVCAILVLAASVPVTVLAATSTTAKSPAASACPTVFSIDFTGKDGINYVTGLKLGEDHQARLFAAASGSGTAFYLKNNKLYRNYTNDGFGQYLQIDTDRPDDIDAGTIFVSDEYNKEYNLRNRRPVTVTMNPKTCRLTFEFQDFIFTEWIQRGGTQYFYMAQDQGRPEPGVNWMLLTKAVAVPVQDGS